MLLMMKWNPELCSLIWNKKQKQYKTYLHCDFLVSGISDLKEVNPVPLQTFYITVFFEEEELDCVFTNEQIELLYLYCNILMGK